MSSLRAKISPKVKVLQRTKAFFLIDGEGMADEEGFVQWEDTAEIGFVDNEGVAENTGLVESCGW